MKIGAAVLIGIYLCVLVTLVESDRRLAQPCTTNRGKILHDILLADPSNCRNFLQCTHGRAIQMNCPHGLFFNPSIDRCDYKENVACKGNACNKDNGGCQQKCIYVDNNSYRCECESGYQLDRNGDQKTCIQGSVDMATYCRGKHGQSLPDPRRCDGFVKCKGDDSKTFRCPGGLIYHRVLRQCVWKWQSECEGVDFTHWSRWSACYQPKKDATCIQERTRECSTGGKLCEGFKSEIRACKKEKCKSVSPCSYQNGGCMETCRDKGGEAVCSCRNGRILANDRKSCTSATCGVAPLRDDSIVSFIVDGQTVARGSYPWQAGIYIDEVFTCGGTLIDNRHVITAAHCFDENADIEYVKVVLGDHDRTKRESSEKVYDIEKILVHEGFDMDSVRNDIAILTLSDDVLFSDYISPLCLPNPDEELRAGTSCHVTGWGKVYNTADASETLQEITLPIVEEEKCKRRNNNRGPREVTEQTVCAGHDDGMTIKSACRGDSGGPLSCMSNGVWKLYGVVSWGDRQCSILNMYNVFTKVSSYVEWITRNK